MIQEARELLIFACKAYKAQMRGGRVFLHEHPDSAQSWMTEEIAEVMDSPGVVRKRLDMCRFNLRAKEQGKEGLVLKPTSITNREALGNHLARRCHGNHKHIHLKG